MVTCNTIRYDGHIFYRISTPVSVPEISADLSVEVYACPMDVKTCGTSSLEPKQAIHHLYRTSRLIFVHTSCKEYLQPSPPLVNIPLGHSSVRHDSSSQFVASDTTYLFWMKTITEFLTHHDLAKITGQDEQDTLRIRPVDAATKTRLRDLTKTSERLSAWSANVTHYEVFPNIYANLVCDILAKMNQASSASHLHHNLWMRTVSDPPNVLSEEDGLARSLLNALADSSSPVSKLLFACNRWKKRWMEQQPGTKQHAPLITLPRPDESVDDYFGRIDASQDVSREERERILGIVGLLHALTQ